MKQRTFILNLKKKKTYQGTTQTVNSSLPKHVKDEPLLINSKHKEQQHNAERERKDQLQKCIDHVTAQDNTKPKKHTKEQLCRHFPSLLMRILRF